MKKENLRNEIRALMSGIRANHVIRQDIRHLKAINRHRLMSKKALLIILAALSRCEPCPAITSAELDRLIPALIQVESGGNDSAVGDSGRAVGCLQIWPVVVEDVNRLSGKSYTLKDRLDRQRSVSMAKIYLMHYAKTGTIEQAARKWNGGPTGDKKAATVKYWEKVRKELK